MNPRPKMAKFVLTTWAACLARQKPVSTSAKPACMKITRTAPMTTHSRLTLPAERDHGIGLHRRETDRERAASVTSRVLQTSGVRMGSPGRIMQRRCFARVAALFLLYVAFVSRRRDSGIHAAWRQSATPSARRTAAFGRASSLRP